MLIQKEADPDINFPDRGKYASVNLYLIKTARIKSTGR